MLWNEETYFIRKETKKIYSAKKLERGLSVSLRELGQIFSTWYVRIISDSADDLLI
jgi:hypothetical protein